MFGFFETIRQKSEQLIDVYKKDIQEFAGAIAEETKPVATLLLPSVPTDTPQSPEKTISKLDDLQHHVSEIKADEEDALPFAQFAQSFIIDEKTAEISELIKQDPVLSQFHNDQVPQAMPYATFWTRYFYRVELNNKKEEVRKKLNNLSAQAQEDVDAWEDDDDTNVDNSKDNTTLSKEDFLAKQVEILKQLRDLVVQDPEKRDEKQTMLLASFVELYQNKLQEKDAQIVQVTEKLNATSNAIVEYSKDHAEGKAYFAEHCAFLFPTPANVATEQQEKDDNWE